LSLGPRPESPTGIGQAIELLAHERQILEVTPGVVANEAIVRVGHVGNAHGNLTARVRE
jgi:hypothetical protein